MGYPLQQLFRDTKKFPEAAPASGQKLKNPHLFLTTSDSEMPDTAAAKSKKPDKPLSGVRSDMSCTRP
jgi:hypothetical protein